ncbi:MAG: hypothetical protein K8S18_06845, partial [Desulfobacula sp.]|nr:hypothetical protein [Desulfobacula sp.]
FDVVFAMIPSFFGDEIYGAIFLSIMQCGNDNLMGQTPVLELATMILFGIGLLVIASIGKKRIKK